MKRSFPAIATCAVLATAGCRQSRSTGPAAGPEETKIEVAQKPPPPQPVAPETVAVESVTAPGAEGTRWSFDDVSAGGGPAGWTPGESNGAGTPATWETVAREDAPSPPNAYGVTVSANSGQTFNVALAQGTSYKDVDLTVAVLAKAGSEDQGGGPVWRAADTNNYYIARWNPLEGNFRVYFVKDGRRRQLATAEATDDKTRWHSVRVVHRGSRIECYLDGEKLLEVDDTTFQSAGQIGLWTKADAATLFDDLRVEPAR